MCTNFLPLQATEAELATHIEATSDKMTQLNVDIQASARSAKKVWLILYFQLSHLHSP
jgi:hypothetical protein